jgi:hypothetical protein
MGAMTAPSRRLLLATIALRLAGALVLAIGLGHVFMPTIGYAPEATVDMSTETKDHFYYLGTYAICAFLLSFGVLAFWFSRDVRSRDARFFAAVMTAVWSARLALELRYPVAVRLFVLDHPHPVLLAVIGVIVAAFATSLLAAKRQEA